jgi:serine/threonine protein kinase
MKEQRNYQILNTIATGGTAVLYKAIQSSLDRQVVIKRLHSHLTSDPNFTRRFELEAKAAASLDHENIVRIIDFGSTDDNYYIVMEYIDGLSLKEVYEKLGSLGTELVLLIAHEICMGLDHAHQRGIIHRDIKPANIMITNDGQVKITDFGLAKLHQSQTQQTVANTLLGTPLYMSPEQAIGDAIDGRSDLFSLGTICYEMLSGTQPFMGDNYAAVIQNILHGTITPPSKLGKEVPAEVETIVMRSLNREPSKRYRTALEMARAIEAVLGQDKILNVRTRLRRLISGQYQTDVERGIPEKSPRTKRRMLPFFISSMITLAVILLFVLDPDRLETIRSRFSALSSPDPVPAATEQDVHAIDALQGSAFEVGGLENAISETPHIGYDPGGTSVDTPTIDRPVEAGEKTVERDAPPRDTLDAEQTQVHEGTHSGAAPIQQPPSREDKKPPVVAGYLSVTVEPDAEILIDGTHRLHGNSLGPLQLPSGEHEIICRKEGYREYRERVSIKRGELSRRNIILQQITGSVSFITDAGAQIYIDGLFKGRTPLEYPITLPSGEHRIELRKIGCKEWSNVVYIPANETLQLRVTLVPR